MKIGRPTNIRTRLIRIEEAVRQAAWKFVDATTDKQIGPQDWPTFSTTAPNKAEYAAFPAITLYMGLEDLGLPRDFSFADLGSGLGNACFPAALYFKHAALYFKNVVGFELDSRLCAEAEGIGREHGFNNISFRNEDFLKADLSPFQVIFTYHPFRDNFIPLMKKRLRDIPSGTIIISILFNHVLPSIFTRDIFQKIYPALGSLETEPATQDPFLAEFNAYRRR